MLILIKILTWLASPVGVFVAGLLLALLLMARARLSRPRRSSTWAKILITGCSLQLFVFALPPVADALLGNLEQRARASAGTFTDKSASSAGSTAAEAEKILQNTKYAAIVVLGGAMRPVVPSLRPHPDLNDAADRLWHAARLYKRGLSPRIVVSGGRGPGMEYRNDLATEAQMMRQFLIELGVPAAAILMEENSRTTRENAELTKRMLAGGAANARIALVTSAFHMPRARENFKEVGLLFDTYPTDFRVAPSSEPLYARLLPNAESLYSSTVALKEHVALLVRY